MTVVSTSHKSDLLLDVGLSHMYLFSTNYVAQLWLITRSVVKGPLVEICPCEVSYLLPLAPAENKVVVYSLTDKDF